MAIRSCLVRNWEGRKKREKKEEKRERKERERHRKRVGQTETERKK